MKRSKEAEGGRKERKEANERMKEIGNKTKKRRNGRKERMEPEE